MDRIFQVFISSTFEDLKDERQQVSNALAKAGYIAAGMELFPASDQQQLEYIQRIINRSDYYVVLVAGRYGSLADNGLSYTENEFDYARSKGIPVLAFLPANPTAIAVGKTEADETKRKKLDDFKTKLKAGRIVEHWSNADDLCLKVVTAVAHAMNLSPRAGWIRGDQALDPIVLRDLQRLRIENDGLRQQLASADGSAIIFDPGLLGPDDIVDIQYSVTPPRDDSPPKPETFSIQRPLGHLFLRCYDLLRVPSKEREIAATLAAILAREEKKAAKRSTYNLTAGTIRALRIQLEALDLIRISVASSGDEFIDDEYTWQATEKGRRYATLKLALRKHEPSA